jgi:hypothetical protein
MKTTGKKFKPKSGLSPEETKQAAIEAEARRKAREHHKPVDHSEAKETAVGAVRGLPNTGMANLGAAYLEIMEFLSTTAARDVPGVRLLDILEGWRATRQQNVQTYQKDPPK